MNTKSTYRLVSIFLILLGFAFLSALSILGIETAGRNIPQPDLLTDYFTALAWAMSLGLSIILWPVPKPHKQALGIVWLAKIFVMLGVMLFYEYNYSLDAGGYFYSAKTGYFAWEDFVFGEGTTNMFNLARFHQQYFIADSYHAMKVTSAMIGMVAVYIFYRAAILFLKRDDLRIFYAIALYPSILFWSSILGKDPLMLIGVALYVYGIVGWQQSGGVRYIGWGALGIWIASFMRLWYGVILVAPLAVFFIKGTKNPLTKILFIGLVIAGFLSSFSMFSERFSVETTEDLVATTDKISGSWGYGGSGQQISGGVTSVGKMVAFAPIGSFTALFRPLPGEVLNPFGLFSGLENLVLLWLLFRAMKRTKFKELKEPLILWALALVIGWSVIYGFVSFQNLGSAVRFKLQILPVLLGLLLYLARTRKPVNPGRT
jgi:hypothetical protein